MDLLGVVTVPAEVEIASYAVNAVPIVTGLVYFVRDYQLLKSQCDWSSLEDCRKHFLRQPSTYMEYTKIIYSRMVLDLIGVFYDPNSQGKENEMILCASWSLILFLYLAICQKALFTCAVMAYLGHQSYLGFSKREPLFSSSLSDHEKYELLKEACSGSTKSFDILLAGTEAGDHVSAGFTIFVLTSNESNVEPDLEKATEIAHQNLDLFIDAAKRDDVFALATMSFLFMRGLHVPKDDLKAVQYGLKAVRTDHPYANLILGWVYLAREQV